MIGLGVRYRGTPHLGRVRSELSRSHIDILVASFVGTSDNMMELQFGTSKLPAEICFLQNQEHSITEDKLKVLIEAAGLHVAGCREEAARLFHSVCADSPRSRLPELYGGLVTLLEAIAAIPPSRRHVNTLTAALRRIRIPESWQPVLVTAMCAKPTPESAAETAPVSWNLDVVIADSERGRVLEPSVGLLLNLAPGNTTQLQFPKAQFLRFRQEMAIVQQEMEVAQPKNVARPS